MKKVFMDHASTTQVDDEVVKTMLPFFTQYYGNPSSIHTFGLEAKEAVDKSRNQVASLLGGTAEDIIFTAGGTEADNIAIKGVAYLHKDQRNTKGPHIITSAIEHPAVLESCKHLASQGFKVEYLPVDKYGLIDLEILQELISKQTFLISIMFANNEIGTIEPVNEIGRLAHDHNVLFHTDAVQAVSKVPIDVEKMHIDMLALSAHKMYGPKGIGALHIKEGIELQPIIHGGGHEKGLRSSTHNVPGIVGLGTASELAEKRMDTDVKTMIRFRDRLIEQILTIESSYLNGHPVQRLCNNAHFRFTGIEGESILLALNEKGIAASTGSACSSRKLRASHVLTELGLGPEELQGSIRLSIGRKTVEDEISYVSESVEQVVEKLRQMSPLWNR